MKKTPETPPIPQSQPNNPATPTDETLIAAASNNEPAVGSEILDSEGNPLPGGQVQPDPLAVLTQKVAELQDKLLRVQADFDNYRKRLAREKEEAIKYANADLLETILPVIDNFELGLQAAETATDAKSIALGMQMVKTQLQRFLADCGVTEIEAIGKKFDPHLHDAISQQESTEHADGIILSQQRKGYKLKDRLLRPSAVVVAHKPTAS